MTSCHLLNPNLRKCPLLTFTMTEINLHQNKTIPKLTSPNSKSSRILGNVHNFGKSTQIFWSIQIFVSRLVFSKNWFLVLYFQLVYVFPLWWKNYGTCFSVIAREFWGCCWCCAQWPALDKLVVSWKKKGFFLKARRSAVKKLGRSIHKRPVFVSNNA